MMIQGTDFLLFLGVGIALGATYLVLLWVSVTGHVRKRRGLGTLLCGLGVRLGIVLAVLAVLAHQAIMALVAGLLGFTTARMIVTRWCSATGRTGQHRHGS